MYCTVFGVLYRIVLYRIVLYRIWCTVPYLVYCTLLIYKVYIYILCLSVWVFIFVGWVLTDKCQYGWTDLANIFCWTSHDQKKNLWMVRTEKTLTHIARMFFYLRDCKRNFKWPSRGKDSNLKRYPWNLDLIKNVKGNFVLLTSKVFHSIYLYREPRNEINS